jgi:hypothetical protein
MLRMAVFRKIEYTYFIGKRPEKSLPQGQNVDIANTVNWLLLRGGIVKSVSRNATIF